ncbi:DUF6538 domain-containing protein [Burkholderia sp. LMG 13014]|uniref:DUF6538 domain-containing protein n=1 Tax=Burkholderia sp. LMG 13014 TaxID=2709306 RepID=UPI001965EC11|nr:DUF6538 domain-containing protein [Burkholderia sp. LMG 13014]
MIVIRTKRPTYLTTTASGVFAFNIAIPADLREPGMPAAVLRSLRTKKRTQARALASRIAFDCRVLFNVARDAGDDAIKALLPDSIRSIVDETLHANATAATTVAPSVEQAVDDFRAEIDAMWNAPLASLVPRTPEPEHPHVHVVLPNNAREPVYRRRFFAFEHGPVQPHRVRRWTVLRHVPSPKHSDPALRYGEPDFGDLFDSV